MYIRVHRSTSGVGSGHGSRLAGNVLGPRSTNADLLCMVMEEVSFDRLSTLSTY